MKNEGIIRNRAKIEATISQRQGLSRVFRSHAVRSIFMGLCRWPSDHQFADINSKDVQPETDVSKRMSKALKADGFRFVGSTTLYAFMQSTGMVNDHLVSCFRHGACAKLQKKLKIAGL